MKLCFFKLLNWFNMTHFGNIYEEWRNCECFDRLHWSKCFLMDKNLHRLRMYSLQIVIAAGERLFICISVRKSCLKYSYLKLRVRWKMTPKHDNDTANHKSFSHKTPVEILLRLCVVKFSGCDVRISDEILTKRLTNIFLTDKSFLIDCKP